MLLIKMKPQMIGLTLALTSALAAQANVSQQKTPTSPGVGVHYPWLDEMRKQGIKRAVVWIGIRFDRKGHPKEMKMNHIEYFAEYEGATPISDSKRLAAIRATTLERELETLALERARHGFWAPGLRLPRPHPFIGGTQIEFIDDEQHHIPHGALYFVKNTN